MGNKLKYLFAVLYLSANLIAQKTDSSNFKLKSFFIGVELGRSPMPSFNGDEEYDYLNVNVKSKPYYAILAGYNFKVFKNNFITPKLGFSSEYIDYTTQSRYINFFNYTQNVGPPTTYLQGRITETTVQTNKINSSYALLGLDYQKYFSSFKNENTKLFLSAGAFLKFGVFSKSQQTYSYIKDSLSSIIVGNIVTTNFISLKNQFNEDEIKYSRFTLSPNIAFGSGIFFNKKYLQHKIGLILNIRFNTNYDFYLDRYISAFQLKFTYSINI